MDENREQCNQISSIRYCGQVHQIHSKCKQPQVRRGRTVSRFAGSGRSIRPTRLWSLGSFRDKTPLYIKKSSVVAHKYRNGRSNGYLRVGCEGYFSLATVILEVTPHRLSA